MDKQPKRITQAWMEKAIKRLNLSAFQITAARILLKTNGQEAVMKYLESIETGLLKDRKP